MGEARRRKQLDPNYGASRIEALIKTLSSNEFKEHISRTLRGMPSDVYEFQIARLVSCVRQGLRNKWLGITFPGIEYRIGYENGKSCYTMIAENGIGKCFNYGGSAEIIIAAFPDNFTPYHNG